MKSRSEIFKQKRNEMSENSKISASIINSDKKVKILLERIQVFFPEYILKDENIFKFHNIDENEIKLFDLSKVQKTLENIIEEQEHIKKIELDHFDKYNFSSGKFEEDIKSLKEDFNEITFLSNKETDKNIKLEEITNLDFSKKEKEENMENIKIAIDGHAGSGKSTVAHDVAKQLNFLYISTGLMYRALAYKVIESKIDYSKELDVFTMFKKLNIDLKQNNVVLLDGEDITLATRGEEVSKMASAIAQYKTIRELAVKLQQDIASKGNVVMDGRDIASKVLPNAQIKIYMWATPEKRAERRAAQNESIGIESDYNDVLAQIIKRDENDINRKESPLVQTKDAIYIDTTNKTIEEVVQYIIELSSKI